MSRGAVPPRGRLQQKRTFRPNGAMCLRAPPSRFPRTESAHRPPLATLIPWAVLQLRIGAFATQTVAVPASEIMASTDLSCFTVNASSTRNSQRMRPLSTGTTVFFPSVISRNTRTPLVEMLIPSASVSSEERFAVASRNSDPSLRTTLIRQSNPDRNGWLTSMPLGGVRVLPTRMWASLLPPMTAYFAPRCPGLARGPDACGSASVADKMPRLPNRGCLCVPRQ